MTQAGTGGRHVQLRRARGRWQTTGARRGEDEFSPTDFRESTTLLTPLFQTSGFQNCETINFC